MPLLKDIESIFKKNATPTLILKPCATFTIAAVNDAFVKATNRTNSELIDRPIFDAFPDQNINDELSAVKCVRKALLKVLETKQDFEVGPVRYDLGLDEESKDDIKYWKAYTSPIVNENGELEYILYTVKDVTKKHR